MRIFNRSNDELAANPDLEKARRRVARLSTHEMLNWADSAGSGMAKAFSDFRKYGEKSSLEEIEQGITGLRAVTEELKARHDVV